MTLPTVTIDTHTLDVQVSSSHPELEFGMAGPTGPPGPAGPDLLVTFPTGSEPPLTGVPDGTLWVEYAP